jgi:hypothetical protein
MSQVWVDQFPWIKNDVTRNSEGFFKCQDSIKCRTKKPSGETNEVWTRIENRFPVKFNRENEVETPPEASYTHPCAKIVEKEIYKLDQEVCDNSSGYNNVYRCEKKFCKGNNLEDGWFLTRALGNE